MTNIALPLRVTSSGLAKERSLKRSIDASIELLLTTRLFSSASDPMFGFVFNNVRFEIFDEHIPGNVLSHIVIRCRCCEI